MNAVREDRDQYVLNYMIEHETTHGEIPSARFIARTFRLDYTSVYRSIDRLVRNGRLKRVRGKLEIVT